MTTLPLIASTAFAVVLAAALKVIRDTVCDNKRSILGALNDERNGE